MITKIIRIVLLVALLLAPRMPGTRVGAHPGSAASKGVSPAGMLNPDGTLNLAGNFSGSLDLSGFNVQMDPQRGPVFARAGGGKASSPAADAPAPGQWAGLGSTLWSINSYVYAIAISGTNVYIAGDFMNANNLPAADFIVRWDGSTWSALGNNGAGDGALNNVVYTLAVSGTYVYAGGWFTNVSNYGTVIPTADFVARWDGSIWSALGSNGVGDGSLNGTVNVIALNGTDVYVGGIFTNVKNGLTMLTAADYLARWDGVNWSALGGDNLGNGALNNVVHALAVDGSGNLYVGGAFTDVRVGMFILPSADYIAKWDGVGWSALGSNGASDGSLNNTVFAIAVNGAVVYAGGQFTDVNNSGASLTAADYIARWDGANWSALGGNGHANGSIPYPDVRAIGITGVMVYVGGTFVRPDNNGTLLSANYLVSWNGSDWSAPAATAVDGALSSDVHAVAVSGANVYVGGNFRDVGAGATALGAADYIAKWNGASWSALGSNGLGDGALNNPVEAIAVSGSNVYVGGVFTDVNNNGAVLPAADYIARWDGANWSALGSNGAPGEGSLNNEVTSLAIIGSDVYAGGNFTNVNNHGTVWGSADYVARWDGADWSPLLGNGSGDGSLNSIVLALAQDGSGNLFVGGYFTDVNNGGNLLTAADYIAKWDGSNWSALGSDGASGEGSLNNYVDVIAASGPNVYVGGHFTDVNNNGVVLGAADGIAKWNGAAWSALGHDASGDGALGPSEVYAILVSGSNVYVGGDFTNVKNGTTTLTAADYVARWDGSNWSALGSNGAGDGALNSIVYALAQDGSNLYGGGGFQDLYNNGTLLDAADFVAAYGIGPIVPTPTPTATLTKTSTRTATRTATPTPTRTATRTATHTPAARLFLPLLRR